MPCKLLHVVGLLLLSAPVTLADDPVFSGPQPGEKLTPFQVLGFSGPMAGQQGELLAQAKGGPLLLVFVHEVTRPAFQLMRPIDRYGAQWAASGLATHFVWLSADVSQTEQFLRRARSSLNLKSPVSISLDGAEGPGNYGLNRNVTLTVLVAKDDKVVASFAIVQPNETDAPRVLAEVAKLVNQRAPTIDQIRAERTAMGAMRGGRAPRAAGAPAASSDPDRIKALEEQVRILTEALNDARARIAKLEGAPAPRELGVARPAGAGRPKGPQRAPELASLMRSLIQPRNDEAAVRDAAESLRKWAGSDAKKKAELADYCRQVLGLGYGTDAAKRALRSLAGE